MKSTLVDDLHRLFCCYGNGIGILAFVISVPAALLPFPIVWTVGAIMGLPALVTITVLIIVFRRIIHRHLTAWCCLTPFLTVLITVLVVEGPSIDRRLSLEDYWSWLMADEWRYIYLMIFIGAAISAKLFHQQTRETENEMREAPTLRINDRSEVRP